MATTARINSAAILAGLTREDVRLPVGAAIDLTCRGKFR